MICLNNRKKGKFICKIVIWELRYQEEFMFHENIWSRKRHNWKCEMGQQPGPGGFKQPKSKHYQLTKAGGNT